MWCDAAGVVASGVCGMRDGLASAWLGVVVTGGGCGAAVGRVLLTGRGGGGGGGDTFEVVERGSAKASRTIERGCWMQLDGCGCGPRSSLLHASVDLRIVSSCNCCFCDQSYRGCEGP